MVGKLRAALARYLSGHLPITVTFGKLLGVAHTLGCANFGPSYYSLFPSAQCLPVTIFSCLYKLLQTFAGEYRQLLSCQQILEESRCRRFDSVGMLLPSRLMTSGFALGKMAFLCFFIVRVVIVKVPPAFTW